MIAVVDYLGIAAVLGAVTLMIPAVVGAIVMFRRVKKIDVAVNGKAPGEPTMVSEVHDLAVASEAEGKTHEPYTNGDAMLPLLRRIALDDDAVKKTLAEVQETLAELRHNQTGK